MCFINRLRITFAVLLASAATVRAGGGVVIPSTGLDSVGIDQRFVWEGIGLIDSLTGPGADFGNPLDPYWEVSVGQASALDLLALDGFIAGDSFELYVNSILTPWSSEFFDGSGYFHGEMDDLVVGAGTTQFTIGVRSGSFEVTGSGGENPAFVF